MKQQQTTTTDIFDAQFKFFVRVPIAKISHLPPPRLNITRLVFCRNYRANDPLSCSMGASCKFVHIDTDVSRLTQHSVHVNYAWRSCEQCTYPRLSQQQHPSVEEEEKLATQQKSNKKVKSPSGERVEILSSDLLLVTRGSLKLHNGNNSEGTLCAQYSFNRVCNHGEDCNFIHAVFVDPAVVGDFKRAPGKSAKAKLTPEEETILREQEEQQPPSSNYDCEEKEEDGINGSTLHHTSESCDSCGNNSDTDEVEVDNLKAQAPPAQQQQQVPQSLLMAPRCYRHNPYSLLKVAVWV
jgi:flagellum-specific peptidoglycan hydrolase FlgJ